MGVFIDTGMIVAIYNERDSLRQKAVELMSQITSGVYGSVYISDYVIDEAITLLFARTGNISLSKDLANRLFSSKSMELLYVSESIFKKSGGQYLTQTGTLSFTDCTIVELMKQNNITYIATFDAGFKSVAGIKVIGI